MGPEPNKAPEPLKQETGCWTRFQGSKIECPQFGEIWGNKALGLKFQLLTSDGKITRSDVAKF
jgi:hypothetical protein